MANDEQVPAERRGRGDWTGLAVAALMAPIFIVFVYLGKAEMGFTAYLVSCVFVIAIKLRWNLRRHAWFWATIALMMAVQIPLLAIVQWPQSNVPTIVFSVPLGIADFLLISGALSLAQKLFLKSESSITDNK